MAHKMISKQEAIKQGLKTYFTGKPCPKGHIAPINVKGRCVICAREGSRESKRKAKAGNKATKGKFPVVTKSAFVSGIVVPETPTNDWRFYSDRITAAWQRALASIIETGKLLVEAKSKVDHGDWLKLVEELPFSDRTAQRLMEIARHPVLSNPTHASVLPPSWYTLYELSQIDNQVLLARIEDHTINPEMQRKDVKAITGVRSKTSKRRYRNPPDHVTEEDVFGELSNRIISTNRENENLRAHIAELEAARDTQTAEVTIEQRQAEMAALDVETTDAEYVGFDDMGHPITAAEAAEIAEHDRQIEAHKAAYSFDLETDDEPTMARKIVMVIGRERAVLLCVELQKLLSGTSSPSQDEAA